MKDEQRSKEGRRRKKIGNVCRSCRREGSLTILESPPTALFSSLLSVRWRWGWLGSSLLSLFVGARPLEHVEYISQE